MLRLPRQNLMLSDVEKGNNLMLSDFEKGNNLMLTRLTTVATLLVKFL